MKALLYLLWFVLVCNLSVAALHLIGGEPEVSIILLLCGSHVVRSIQETRRELA